MLGSKKHPKNSRRPAGASRSATKITNYYSPTARANQITEIDMSAKRRSTKRSNSAKGLRARLVGRLKKVVIITISVVFLYNLLYLKQEPIIVLDGNSNTERLSTYEPSIAILLGNSVLSKTKLSIRSDSIEDEIIHEFPELKAAVVTTTLVGKRPIVHLYLLPISFTIESQGSSYVVSENGVVAGLVTDFRGVESAIPIKDESGVDIRKGSRILRSDDAKYFLTVIDVLKGQGRRLEGVRLTTIPREAYLKIAKLPYEVRVYLDDRADLQMATLFSTEETLKGRGETPLLYIDLRAGEKVFWR